MSEPGKGERLAVEWDLELTRRRAVAEEACRAAAAVHLKYRQPSIDFTTKRHRRDLVTIADTEAQHAAVAVIEAAFPGERIVGEEDGPSARQIAAAARDAAWFLDPLDGTFNYVHGFPDYSATVGFVAAGQPVAGATFAPSLDEMFSAAGGQGATLNGAPIRISGRTKLRDCIATVWLGRAAEVSPDVRMARVRRAVFSHRSFGGTAIILAYLACGRFDVSYVAPGSGIGPWDMAAGIVLIQEAGGVAQLPDGRPFALPARGMCAAGAAATLDELRALLA